MLVAGISTMALVIVLSVFNGLEGLLRNLYGSFDADIIVTPTAGKSFEYTDDIYRDLITVEAVESVADVIEDNVLIRYKGAQRVVRLKGVSEDFQSQGRFDEALTFGPMKLKEDSVGFAIVGRGIQYMLGINLKDDFYPLQIFYPRDIGPGQLNPERMFTMKQILPGSIFAVEKSIDENFLFVPVEFATELLNYGNKRTALEIKVVDGFDLEKTRDIIADQIGGSFNIITGDESHSSLYKILQWEKVFVFLTFGIILLIGSVNIYFSLSMLVIDKRKDIAILKALGAERPMLRRIFLSEGCIIAFVGAFSGLILGLLIAFGQQEFGWVSMGVPGAISDAYPVKIESLDIMITTLLIVLITVLASIQPARKAAQTSVLKLQE